MKGYKVFNCNWMTCNHFQWEVGKTYKHAGDLEMCASGFHFCKSLLECFRYYDFNPKNKVAEVEALGNIEEDDHKCITDKIKIVREIPWEEVLTIVNIGYGNTGYKNSGNYNSGNRNTGIYNSGAGNTGNYNSGYYNTADHNTGDFNTGNHNTGRSNSGGCNTGYRNTGDYNSGYYNTGSFNTGNYNTGWQNSGNYNSGSYNIGDYNSGCFNASSHSIGFFNTEPSTIYMFNKPCDLTWKKINELPGIIVLRTFKTVDWIDPFKMTNEEKEARPEYTVTEGYLKINQFKEAFEKFWQELDEYDRQSIKDLPNFDPGIFKSITGIEV